MVHQRLDFILCNLEVLMKGRQFSMNVRSAIILGQSTINNILMAIVDKYTCVCVPIPFAFIDKQHGSIYLMRSNEFKVVMNMD